MKHEVRDDDVVFFGGCEPEHVTTLESNPVREAKYPRVLFRLLWAGPFEARVLERVNPSYPRVLVEFSTDTAQESKAATHIENPQLVISPERKRSEGIGEHGLHDRTYFLGSRRCRMVVGPEVWFLRFVSFPRRFERTQLTHVRGGQAPNIYFWRSDELFE